jgi:hypothetical protein
MPLSLVAVVLVCFQVSFAAVTVSTFLISFSSLGLSPRAPCRRIKEINGRSRRQLHPQGNILAWGMSCFMAHIDVEESRLCALSIERPLLSVHSGIAYGGATTCDIGD